MIYQLCIEWHQRKLLGANVILPISCIANPASRLIPLPSQVIPSEPRSAHPSWVCFLRCWFRQTKVGDISAKPHWNPVFFQQTRTNINQPEITPPQNPQPSATSPIEIIAFRISLASFQKINITTGVVLFQVFQL